MKTLNISLVKTDSLSRIRVQDKLNVLHVIKSLGRGGAEKLLVETLREHDQSRFRFSYVYFLPWKNQLVKDLHDLGGSVTCIKATSSLQVVLSLFRLIAYIRKNKIDLIHSHLPVAGIVARLAGFLTATPVVYTEHNTWERYHRMTYWMNRFTFPLQNKVIAVSGEVASSINRNYTNNRPVVQVVRNGVNTRLFNGNVKTGRNVRSELGIPDSAIVIGITCVFRKQKRLDLWLEIAARLRATFPDLFFIVVGDGVLHDEIHGKAKTLGTGSFVRFVGLQTDIKPYLEAMDIYMMTSEFEGLPVGLLEAMSMGCVPACTSAGGIGEIINDSVNGILVPVSSYSLLYDRICNVILDPVKMELMKKESMKTAISRFGIDRMVNKIEEIYLSATKNTLVS